MPYDKSQFIGSELNNCPPDDAEGASGLIYRLVFHDPPIEKDFIPGAKLYPQYYGESSTKTEEEKCEGHGLSVCISREDAIRVKEANKGKWRKSMIAIANLQSECGRIKRTPKKGNDLHYTWWFPVEMEVWQLFDIVK
ncbi:MAG: hypothetical protein OXI67_07350 [Candidatus Poribacteria bacterium]|nr:hypothetical protein [Candidatus Poribacteria bacterium]